MAAKKTHILGMCGTFMAGVATLAKALGREVSGLDANVYPPMSTYLESLNIAVLEGYTLDNFYQKANISSGDEIIIGNVISRGNRVLEEILNQNMPYQSGPQWLSTNILQDKWRIVVAGTHGKTTTSSMIAWILEKAGLEPGFLIGGIPENFGVSARLTNSPFFVVEGDEYDTAFSDKRSKFVHYGPKTLVLNNLEYDHADIFPNVEAIERQFHHGVRLVPSDGRVIANSHYPSIENVLKMGVWSTVERLYIDWNFSLFKQDASSFDVTFRGKTLGRVTWDLCGKHNAENALSAIAAAVHVGVDPLQAIESLSSFKGVMRRMQCRGEVGGVRVYDDFAHHPTAISVTLEGVKSSSSEGRVIAVLEPRSNTMRLGQHRAELAKSIVSADRVLVYEPANLTWNMSEVFENSSIPVDIFSSTEAIIDRLLSIVAPQDRVVVMSNGGFENIHERLLQKLREKFAS
jgi:UDP-N-acetylmuramate: L-alanyl-gamma-D-glutamyl-meso-diaminopimelate ligase